MWGKSLDMPLYAYQNVLSNNIVLNDTEPHKLTTPNSGQIVNLHSSMFRDRSGLLAAYPVGLLAP